MTNGMVFMMAAGGVCFSFMLGGLVYLVSGTYAFGSVSYFLGGLLGFNER